MILICLIFFFFHVFGDSSTFSWMQKYGIQLWSQNIPHSLLTLKYLQHLWVTSPPKCLFTELLLFFGYLVKNSWFFFSFRNLSHNLLLGPIGNVFTGLQNLREMYVFFTWSLYFLYPDVWSEKKVMHSTTFHEI